jgi:uncharacterized protein (TIGR02285 family)
MAIIVVLAMLTAPTVPAAMSAAQDADISWFIPQTQPCHIETTESSVKGYCDGMVSFLTKNLPDYRHQIAVRPIPRLWHEIAHRDGVCTVVAGKSPERLEQGVFSERPFWSITNRVIIAASRSALFQPYVENRIIDLDALGQNAQLRGLVLAGKNYGPVINAFLASPQRAAQIIPLNSTEFPIKMIMEQRADFVFGYSIDLAYQVTKQKLSGEFVTYAIKGDVTHYDAFVACSNGPLGRRVIASVNQLLGDPANWEAYLRPLQPWYQQDEFESALKY